MDIQQRINLAILEALQNLGAALALPTRTIQLVRHQGEPIEPDEERRGQPHGLQYRGTQARA
ncbi:mscS Mechanosensitive ion channel domain protein [Ralstonia insidiosa]|uniref:MscS Mechanosensitive ion channel domain protein n=2 Tax=Burkholderiaceae TaxID=119060 RepID=A0AAC9FUV0_9RALS|nr:mscS Mechanosensitive ion channel domain protein [Ralstonia insidiosa]EPX98982.1 hypothetical protein C404_05740 [Ralstonia sp. AU12-08]